MRIPTVYRYCEDALPVDLATACGDLLNHLNKGNEGSPWCRYAWRAAQQDAFYVCDARRVKTPIDRLAVALAEWIAAKSKDDPEGRPRTAGKWPSVTGWVRVENSRQTERSIQSIRASLLRRSIVVGLVHPDSTLRSLVQEKGYPYRLDQAFLNVRCAVPNDRVFIQSGSEMESIFNKLAL